MTGKTETSLKKILPIGRGVSSNPISRITEKLSRRYFASIVEGKKRHDEPIEGDQGVQYDPKVFEDGQGVFWYDWDGKVLT
jgi:hypothetical protein